MPEARRQAAMPADMAGGTAVYSAGIVNSRGLVGAQEPAEDGQEGPPRQRDGELLRRMVAGDRIPVDELEDGGMRQRPFPIGQAEGHDVVVGALGRHRGVGRFHRVGQIVERVHDQRGDQVFQPREVVVDGRRAIAPARQKCYNPPRLRRGRQRTRR